MHLVKLVNFGFDSRFISIERQFVKYILSTMESNMSSGNTIRYETKTMLKKLKFDINQLKKVIDSIMVKRFYYVFHEGQQEISGKFCFLNSYYFDGENFLVEIAKEIIEYYTPNSRFFESDLGNLLCLKSNKSSFLFLKVSNSKKEGEGFQISMKELKEILQIETEYNRFYDFERHVIKDIVDDINENSFSKISYQKVKKGSSSTHKIESIIFYMLNNKQVILKEETNLLLELVKYRVKDLSTINHMIRTTLKKHGYLYVKENIEYVLRNKQKGVDIELIRALKENPSNQIQGIITGKASDLICSFDKYYSDIQSFKNKISEELHKQQVTFTYNTMLIKKFKDFEKTYIFNFENHRIRVIGYYSENNLSRLRIYCK